MWDLGKLERLFKANNYERKGIIFCGDETIINQYVNEFNPDDSFWVFYMRKSQMIRVFKDSPEEDWFSEQFAKLHFEIIDVVGHAYDTTGIRLNRAQGRSVLKRGENELSRAMRDAGWAAMSRIVKDAGIEQCQRCKNAVGLLADDEIDPTGIDTYHPTIDGGVCGACKVEFKFDLCNDCELYHPIESMTRIDGDTDIDYARWVCRFCIWDEAEFTIYPKQFAGKKNKVTLERNGFVFVEEDEALSLYRDDLGADIYFDSRTGKFYPSLESVDGPEGTLRQAFNWLKKSRQTEEKTDE